MSNVTDRDASASTEPDTGLDWAALRRQLDRLMREVGEEIRAYPAPIPACDAQFNRLLELRRLLPEELARLEAAAGNPAANVAAFVRASPCRAELEARVRRSADPTPRPSRRSPRAPRARTPGSS